MDEYTVIESKSPVFYESTSGNRNCSTRRTTARDAGMEWCTS